MPLEKELETYKNNLADLAQHEGKFVLIHGDKVVDIFDSYQDALRQGYRDFGVDSFLVRQIHAVEQVQQITRWTRPAPTVGPA
jgi:hypothetical protein